MKNTVISFILLIILLLPASVVMAQKELPSDFCLTDEEFKLAELINAHREAKGIQAIPLSSSLSFVARTHVLDLYNNHPDTSICNLNSWSDKGDWTPCCHNKYNPQEYCVRNKPKELTKYVGEGYELTYAEESDVSADSIYKFWTSIPEADAFLSNEGTWKSRTWKALGVGIYKNYAVVWLGWRTDLEPIPMPCRLLAEKKSKEERKAVASGNVPVISAPTGRFYVVVSSFQSLKDAKAGVKQLVDYSDANICIVKNKQGQCRICINNYETLEGAKNGKELYKVNFKDAWILNY